MIRIVLGILLVLFIPGYLLSLLLFNKLNMLDRIIISIGLSIQIVAVVAILLGGTLGLKSITGGYTTYNVFFALFSISLFEIALYTIKNRVK